MSSKLLSYTFCIALSGVVPPSLALSEAENAAQATSVEQHVSDRALERWNLMIEGRIESAYSYLAPGYRAAHSIAQYSRTVRGGLWKKAAIQTVSCKKQRCAVKVQLDMVLGGKKPVPIWVDETWIQTEQDGEWWYIPPP